MYFVPPTRHNNSRAHLIVEIRDAWLHRRVSRGGVSHLLGRLTRASDLDKLINEANNNLNSLLVSHLLAHFPPRKFQSVLNSTTFVAGSRSPSLSPRVLCGRKPRRPQYSIFTWTAEVEYCLNSVKWKGSEPLPRRGRGINRGSFSRSSDPVDNYWSRRRALPRGKALRRSTE